MDSEGSVAQIRRIVDAGGEIVRLTAQGVREAENLADISSRLRAGGINTPLVADIHFNPRAAFAAASRVEKVRINPGNFVDPGRVFKKIDYTDEEYAAEIVKIEEGLERNGQRPCHGSDCSRRQIYRRHGSCGNNGLELRHRRVFHTAHSECEGGGHDTAGGRTDNATLRPAWSRVRWNSYAYVSDTISVMW